MPASSARPNIIFLFSDQQRYDTLGCNGQPLPVTPNLDQMAAEGVRFTNAISCQPVCGPARACIQTGKYPTTIGCYRNGIALPLNEHTIAHYLKDAGYRVGYVGKWHLASTIGHSFEPLENRVSYEKVAVPPERRGGYTDYWIAADVLEFTSHGYDGFMFDKDMQRVDFTGYRVDCTTDFALRFLDQQSPGTAPFFLFVSYIEPHHQNDHLRYEGPEGSKAQFKDFVVPGDLKDTKGDWRQNYPDYLGCCHSLDMNVGRIRAHLQELGLAENTILIYTSDHGSHFRTRNIEYKRSCHEASVHIPLIITGRSIPRGKVVDELVSLIDYPATILDFAGVPIPATFQGESIKPLIENRSPPTDWKDAVYIQISESQVGRALRTKKWKYSVKAPLGIGWLQAKSDIYMEEFLYDLEKDPCEKHNLVKAPAYRTVREKLATLLLTKIRSTGEPPARIVPYMTFIKRLIFKWGHRHDSGSKNVNSAEIMKDMIR
jgi:uncharacterized sulfatase